MPGILVVVVVVLAGAWWMLSRANELFVLSARGGRVLLLRGRLPRALERELAAVLRQGSATGRLRAVREGGRTRLVGEGLDPELEQRLRNVFFASRYAKMRWLAEGDRRPRNLGQRLGWEWLAWQLAPGPAPAGDHVRVVDEDAGDDSGNGPLQ